MISNIVAVSLLVAVVQAGLIDEGLGFYDDIGLKKGYSGLSNIGISGVSLGGKDTVIDLVAPAKYEYKYGVKDPYTGDQKEQQESRIDDLTKSEYAVAEKDRKIQVSRIIGKSIPVVSKSISIGKY